MRMRRLKPLSLHPPHSRGLMGVAAIVGFILSPLSWWNDAIVNMPLSLVMGTLLNSILGVPLGLGVAVSYLASNVVGMILLVVGGYGAVKGRVGLKDLALGVLLAVAYTVAVLYIL